MGRKKKKVVKPTKKASDSRTSQRTSSAKSALKKIKDFDRCKQWLIEQQNIINEPVAVHDINDDENSEIENENYERRMEQGEKNDPPLRGAARFNINILCEWKRCRIECKNLDEFRAHVDQHIGNIDPVEPYDCHWDLCSYQTDSIAEMTTHIGFHVYHTNLKIVGECYLQSKTNLPQCVLDSRCRNLIPDDTAAYECKWEDCDRQFLKICDFMEHVREHGKFEAKLRRKYQDKTMKCRWMGCKKTFTIIAMFTDHRRTHTKEKQCGCPNCGTTFRNFSKFYDHYRRQSVTNEYQCSQCLKYFFSMELLRNHQHVHVNRYKCTMCDMTTSSKNGLIQHIRYRHISSKPFKCTECDYSAVYKHDLEKHITAVHKNEVYECQECDFSTDKMHMLQKHNRKMHQEEKIYRCHIPFCTKKYNCGNFLSRHLIKKHEFQLPFGHYRFNYRQDLDGFFRVQTTRTESLEVTQQIMLPNQRDAAETNDVTYEVSELHEAEKGLTITVTSKPNEQASSAPVFYDSSNDENLFFTLPDLNFDSNSEEGSEQKSVHIDDSHQDVILENEDSGSPTIPLEPKYYSDADEESSDIKHFSVMRRYLKKEKEKNIIIELNEVDEAGVVFKTQIVKANEFSVTTSRVKSITKDDLKYE